MRILSLLSPLKYYNYIKRKFLLKKLKRVGKNFIIGDNFVFNYPEYVEIGNNVFIGEGAIFQQKLFLVTILCLVRDLYL